jgi:hypothetical protein
MPNGVYWQNIDRHIDANGKAIACELARSGARQRGHDLSMRVLFGTVSLAFSAAMAYLVYQQIQGTRFPGWVYLLTILVSIAYLSLGLRVRPGK